MDQQDDRTFIKKFSGILLGLLLFTVVIIVLAVSMREEPDPADNPSQLSNAKQRIAPVAAVRSGAAGAAELAQAAAAPPPAIESPAAAGAIDGSKVYGGLCQSCHAAGVAGAPVPGSDAMAERAAKGLDALVASAIKGIGIMPAKGGNASLTDDQMRAAIEYMIGQ